MPAPQTTVAIMYDNSIVLLEKEELVYPMSSLIADCGGIMGLFVGFNFIMIWKLLISSTDKLVAAWERRKTKYAVRTQIDVKE